AARRRAVLRHDLRRRDEAALAEDQGAHRGGDLVLLHPDVLGLAGDVSEARVLDEQPLRLRRLDLHGGVVLLGQPGNLPQARDLAAAGGERDGDQREAGQSTKQRGAHRGQHSRFSPLNPRTAAPTGSADRPRPPPARAPAGGGAGGGEKGGARVGGETHVAWRYVTPRRSMSTGTSQAITSSDRPKETARSGRTRSSSPFVLLLRRSSFTCPGSTLWKRFVWSMASASMNGTRRRSALPLVRSVGGTTATRTRPRVIRTPSSGRGCARPSMGTKAASANVGSTRTTCAYPSVSSKRPSGLPVAG